MRDTVSPTEPGRGATILVLGILSLVFGLVLGIVAWVMGSKDLGKIRQGIIPQSEKGKTAAGMTLGIVGTLVHPFALAAVVVALFLPRFALG